MASITNQRIPWIDVSRGLAFLIVIYSHLPQCDDTVMKFFSPMFLTIFFFVSGYLYKSGKSFSEVLEHRTRTLLVPYFILGLLLLCMSQVLSFNNEGESFAEGLKGMILQTGAGGRMLWFIAALFVYSVFFYFVDAYCKTGLQLIVVAFILYFGNCVAWYVFHIDLPWHLNTVGFGCFYMALGKIYRRYEPLIDSHIKWWMVLIVVIVYAVYIAYSGVYISSGGSAMMIDAAIITLIGLVLIITVSKKYLGSSRLLLFVGANSLLYFALHGKVYSLLQTVGKKVSPEVFMSDDFWIKAAVAVGVVLLDALILIPPTILVNKYVPQILGRKFKLWR